MWLGSINQWATNYTGNLDLAFRVEEGGKMKELKPDTLKILLQGKDDLAVMLIGFQIPYKKAGIHGKSPLSNSCLVTKRANSEQAGCVIDLHIERHGSNPSSLDEKKIIPS